MPMSWPASRRIPALTPQLCDAYIRNRHRARDPIHKREQPGQEAPREFRTAHRQAAIWLCGSAGKWRQEIDWTRFSCSRHPPWETATGGRRTFQRTNAPSGRQAARVKTDRNVRPTRFCCIWTRSQPHRCGQADGSCSAQGKRGTQRSRPGTIFVPLCPRSPG